MSRRSLRTQGIRLWYFAFDVLFLILTKKFWLKLFRRKN